MGETWSPRGQGARSRPSFQEEQKDREDSHVETFQIRRSSLSIQDAATLQWGAELESCWEECQRPMGWSSKIQGMNGDLFFSLLGVVQTHCRYILNGCHKQEEIRDLPWDWTNFLLLSICIWGVGSNPEFRQAVLYRLKGDYLILFWWCFILVWPKMVCVPQFVANGKTSW